MFVTSPSFPLFALVALTELANAAPSTSDASKRAASPLAKRVFNRPIIGNVPYGTEVISCTKPGVIALTFDDGPSDLTAGIVETLEKNNIKGTFFVVGKNGEDGLVTGKYDSLIKSMHNNGHHLGSHSFSHPNFNRISYDEKIAELEQNEKAFSDLLGFIPTYFRPPFTACDGECFQALGDMGYHVTDYDLDTKDWVDGGSEAEQRYSSAVRGADSSSSSFIALAHDVQEFTANGFVQYMIDVGSEKGFKFVTLGECLGDSPGNWYRDPETGEAMGTDNKVSDPTTSSKPPAKPTEKPQGGKSSSESESEAESTTISKPASTTSSTTTSAPAIGTPAVVNQGEAASESSASSTQPTSATQESSAPTETNENAAPAGMSSLSNTLLGSLLGLVAWMLV